MKTDKAREFWITKNDNGEPTHIALFEKLNDREQIHVIEHTAVEQLELKVKSLEDEVKQEYLDNAERERELVQKLTAQEQEIEQLKDLVMIARKDAAENREEKIKLQIKLGERNV